MKRLCILLVSLAASLPAVADTLRLPADGDNVVGAVNMATVVGNEKVLDVVRAYDQGFNEVKIANPGIDMLGWGGKGEELVIPSQYVLPAAPHEGVVLNVAEMRLYYYPKPRAGEPRVVITHPVAIGRENWTTPHGVTKVVAKIKDPVWVPPKSIRKEHLEDFGEVLPTVVPAGPDNPMGQFALKLGLPGYYIHGTDIGKIDGIGMRVTHGCIRLYPKDISRLFAEVPVGTPVRIVNQPFKIGRLGDSLYLEAHPHLEDDPAASEDPYNTVVNLLIAAVGEARSEIDWNQIRSAIAARNGIPIKIGRLLDGAPLEAQRQAQQTPESKKELIQQVW